jgi:hypothetical protein
VHTGFTAQAYLDADHRSVDEIAALDAAFTERARRS